MAHDLHCALKLWMIYVMYSMYMYVCTACITQYKNNTITSFFIKITTDTKHNSQYNGTLKLDLITEIAMAVHLINTVHHCVQNADSFVIGCFHE